MQAPVQVWQNQALRQTLDRILTRQIVVAEEHIKTSETLRSLALFVIEHHLIGYSTFYQDIQLKCWNDVNLSNKQIAAAFRVFVNEVQDTLDHLRLERRAAVPAATKLSEPKFAALMGAFERTRLQFDNPDATIALVAAELNLPSNVVRAAYEASLHQENDPYYIELIEDQARPLEVLVTPGTYTVSSQGSPDRTIRLNPVPDDWGKRPGTLIAALFSGSDNESQYTSFAFVMGSSVIPFKKSAATPITLKALETLLSLDIIGQVRAGEAYALRSQRCFVCNRKLTRISSISQGIGPICAEKHSFAERLTAAGCVMEQSQSTATLAPRTSDEEELFPDERLDLVDADDIAVHSRNLGEEDLDNYNREIEAGLRQYQRATLRRH